ncbi:MAG: DUF5666 domain-containing protein [Anaerolineae bacterium]
MKFQSFRRILWVFVLMLATFVFAQGVFAQQTAEVQLVGIIEAMTTDSLTINGRLVDTSQAIVQTALEVGAVVHVEGTLGVDNVIIAREIRAADAGLQPGEVEIIGTVESSAGTTMTVSGQTFDVSAAEIGAGVTVGSLVKIHATAAADGTWIAREVALFTVSDPSATPMPTGEFELVGTLEAIGTQTITVSGQIISIVGAEINDPLVLGVLVKAHVSLVSGQLVAREVELAGRDTTVTVVVVGAVSSINGSVISINGLTITLTAGDPLLATLQVGDVLYVEGSLQADGSVLAIHVRLAADDNRNANDNPNANGNGNDNGNGNGNDNGDDNGNDNGSVGTPTITLQQASEIALGVYPNATITRIELTVKFGGTLVWEVHLSNRIEMNIDASDGTILTIDRPGDDNNANANSNGNDNGDDHGGDNGNDNGNHNDNGDDHGGDNGNDNTDDSGMGSGG